MERIVGRTGTVHTTTSSRDPRESFQLILINPGKTKPRIPGGQEFWAEKITKETKNKCYMCYVVKIGHKNKATLHHEK